MMRLAGRMLPPSGGGPGAGRPARARAAADVPVVAYAVLSRRGRPESAAVAGGRFVDFAPGARGWAAAGSAQHITSSVVVQTATVFENRCVGMAAI